MNATRSRPALGALLVLMIIATLAAPGVFASHITTTLYQAEDPAVATILNGSGVVESTNAGFTGTGYVNYNNVAGSAVRFTINVPVADTYFIAMRYANGTTAERPLRLDIDGIAENGRYPAQPTRPPDVNGAQQPPSFTTWYTDGVQVVLAAGIHTVTLTALTSNGGPNLDRLEVSRQPGPDEDWSTKVVDSTIARLGSAGVGTWEYSRALYLYGQYLTWRRVGGGDTSHPYLTYIRNWVNSHVSSTGVIDRSISNLDNMLPGNLCLLMDRHFGHLDSRYEACARNVRQALVGYPRVQGGFQHSTSSSREGQLWLDGVFMVTPFLMRYGPQIGELTTMNNEAANQLVIYADRTRRPSGLLRHAWWGGIGANPGWADASGQSPEHWCRALGWFGMTHIEVLELLPLAHAQRPQLLATLQALVQALADTQDPLTGLWYQVVDKGSNLQNWHETSCSSMHAYTILRAVQKGYVSATFQANADRGRAGVMKKVAYGPEHDGTSAVPRTNIRNISRGTNVDNLQYYFERVRPVNDMHGLGAFLIMNEAFEGNAGWGGTPPDPDPNVIAALSVKDSANAVDWSIQGDLAVGNRAFGDRTYTFSSVGTLAGADWIRPAADSKSYTGNPLVTFSLVQEADVYVALDDRVPRLSWLDASWVDTGENVTTLEGTATRTLSLFRKRFPAGTVSLGPQSNTTAANYVIVAK